MEEENEKFKKSMAELKPQVKDQPVVTVDYGEVNLKKLTITNDKRIYEDMKTNNSIGILFDPLSFKKAGFNDNDEVYIIGILADK